MKVRVLLSWDTKKLSMFEFSFDPLVFVSLDLGGFLLQKDPLGLFLLIL
jgi:hypothetical protein